MRHMTLVSKRPKLAVDTGLCGTIGSDFQAQLCFVLSFLSSVFVPLFQGVIQLKTEYINPPDTTE
jgi:hypothetical protein